MTRIVLDGRKMDTRAKAHQYIKAAMELPEYYGANLDALYDCLTELHQVKIELTYKEAMLNSLGAYGQAMLHAFQDAARENAGFVFIG